ncbi:hypothetical protein BC940DRAFT_302169 [Gongronella butleri]|nr:hypothetical protein BC940DRAFT_302169 [Gongronella butleri]
MTETMSQTLVEETNRFGGKVKNPSSKAHGLGSPTSATANDARVACYTVILQPQSNQFPTKTLEIRQGAQCKIGRQSGAKTAPKPLNGYFDSKVLSRTHAMLWCDENGVWIKDTKSSNGTFLNGHRLSKETEESEPVALKTGDYIEFGIDIFSEDNNTLLYQKVACHISIFNLSLEQLDRSILQQFNVNADFSQFQVDPYLSRRSSMSSMGGISYTSSNSGSGTITATSNGNNSSHNNKYPASSPPATKTKRSKTLDLLVAKLEAELERSQLLEKEMKNMATKVNELNKGAAGDRVKKSNPLNQALRQQLQEANQKQKMYDEKTRLQNQAILAARQQIKSLEDALQKSNSMTTSTPPPEVVNGLQHELEQLRLQIDEKELKWTKDITQEREHSLALEKRCLALERQLRFFDHGTNVGTSTTTTTTASPTMPKDAGFFSGFVDALQVRSIQLLLGILMAIISALVYLLML